MRAMAATPPTNLTGLTGGIRTRCVVDRRATVRLSPGYSFTRTDLGFIAAPLSGVRMVAERTDPVGRCSRRVIPGRDHKATSEWTPRESPTFRNHDAN